MNPLDFRNNTAFNWRAAFALMKMECAVFFKTYSMLISQVSTPVIYFFFIIAALANTIGAVNINGYSVNYREYAIIGLLSLTMTTQMARVIYRMTVDRKYGFFALKMQSGLHPLPYILAMSSSAVLGYAMQVVILYALTLAFALQISFWHFACMAAVGFVAMFFWIGVGVIITMNIDTYQIRDMVISFLLMPLSFSAPSFYVLNDAPSLIKMIAVVNPLTYQLNVMRGAALGFFDAGTFGIVLALSALALLVAVKVVGRATLIVKENT